ncbi:hypothetical protein [Nocardia fluminea]|uniref:hypothetical protein n=1 Tax=Nocardia fluminea TaxID=134984 RepID=UPI00365AD933
MQALVDRAAAHTFRDGPAGAVSLIAQLRELGATAQIEALTERLPAAGGFAEFLDVRPDLKERFRFGREPADELIPAEPWTWTDLD